MVVTERGVAFSWVTRYPPTGRHCTHCKQWLPFSAFRPNLRLKSGWNSWCRACSAESTKRWRERNADKLRRPRVAPSQKTCVECGASFVGRKDRLLCGARRCKDRRYARLHPEAVRAKQRRKDERRRNAGASPSNVTSRPGTHSLQRSRVEAAWQRPTD